MNNNLEKKYMKYKKKYLNLKYKKKGGGKDYFIPCELIYFTKKILLDNRNRDLYDELNYKKTIIPIDNLTLINNGAFSKYLQDGFIYLKKLTKTNKLDNDSFYIKASSLSQDFESKLSVENKLLDLSNSYGNGNNYGGNFICSPNGFIFYFSGITENLKMFLNSHMAQQTVELNCSFRCKNVRHIDEAMAFMPYGLNESNHMQYKVWIYDIGNIDFNDELKNLLLDEIKYFINISDDDIKKELQNAIKPIKPNPDNNMRINFINENITISNEQINTILKNFDNIDLITKNLKRLRKKNISEKLDFWIRTKLGELIIQKLQNKYKFTLDKSITNLDLTQQKNINYLIKGIQQKIIEFLKLELIQNLELISKNLFNDSSKNTIHNFVLFPINFTVNHELDFTYDIPPIFNRLWVETNGKTICLFPGSADETKSEHFSNIYNIIFKEFTRKDFPVRSFYPKNQLFVQFINTDTKEFHRDGRCGGNLHCLMKQLF